MSFLSDSSGFAQDIHFEKWGIFGRFLKNYISKNRERLEEESYDIILGFSRGGVILAYAFACLLKDGNFDVYASPHKASVRSIPIGLTIKQNDPCFIMNQAATKAERHDISKKLQDDLESFSAKYKNGEPLNLLVIDDNLTGATRVKYLEDKLEEMKPLVAKHDTLAYVRHKAFLRDEIRTIRKFPRKANVFVMPWHEFHMKRDLKFPNEELDLVKLKRFKLKLYFKLINKFSDLDEFKNWLNNGNNFRLKEKLGKTLLINGASIFILKYSNNSEYIELNYAKYLLYPPKQCLKPFNSDVIDSKKNFFKLCSEESNVTKATCLMCSILNCNTELFDRILDKKERKERIKFELSFDEDEDKKMKKAIESWIRWFVELHPEI